MFGFGHERAGKDFYASSSQELLSNLGKKL